ncbi:hypothetical protein [Xylella fastidiosa]|uniref:hypothetical protein n=1 Tax=Xylella fastidiosa TaxID=2371 RepID=UPI0019112626|nr:hypothetical protein [Xylella fastidiosa]
MLQAVGDELRIQPHVRIENRRTGLAFKGGALVRGIRRAGVEVLRLRSPCGTGQQRDGRHKMPGQGGTSCLLLHGHLSSGSDMACR